MSLASRGSRSSWKCETFTTVNQLNWHEIDGLTLNSDWLWLSWCVSLCDWLSQWVIILVFSLKKSLNAVKCWLIKISFSVEWGQLKTYGPVIIVFFCNKFKCHREVNFNKSSRRMLFLQSVNLLKWIEYMHDNNHSYLAENFNWIQWCLNYFNSICSFLPNLSFVNCT